MISNSIETYLPDLVRVSAQHIHQFLKAQAYSETEDLQFFGENLELLLKGSMNSQSIPRFSSLLSHISQAPKVIENQALKQHFLLLRRHLSAAIDTEQRRGQDPRSFPTSAPISVPKEATLGSRSSGLLGSTESMLGKYQVVKKIGEGGNGIVYLGINSISAQHVALKCLTNVRGKDLVDAVRDEARVAARINHPNCVKVRDMMMDQSTGSPVIICDFIDGLNGRDFLEHPSLQKFENNALPTRAALLMLEQMVRGVRAAHKTGIVHRDIKPENFLVTKEVMAEIKAVSSLDSSSAVIQVLENRRDEAWVLLSDWGLALEKKGLSLTTSKTFNLGTIPLSKQGGTLVYMPIEQIEGSNIGRKSDVFALGLV
ncbi:MAG: serine/threonine-protein kinase, partial [Planctomycetota bacterium]|nr:serine/threonine-protein kinase [Planctomycetota bacterium]